MPSSVESPPGLLPRLSRFLATIAPGIFLIGYNIGTGSITTMASAGASYGMALLWPLLLACIFTYYMIVLFGRFTAVTGQTALTSFRAHFGSGWALFILASVVLSEWVATIGVMAVVTQVVQEWSRPFTASGEGFSPLWLTVFFGGLLYWLYWGGRYRFFEKVLAVFVGLMGVSFLLTLFMVRPDAGEVVRGVVPHLPPGSNAALLVAGMVGTTMGGVLFVMRSILVKEKGWTVKDLRIERRDALISASVMFGLSVAVMAAAAGTLHPRGLRLENAIDMVRLFEPLAGRFATTFFVVGIVSAGLSSIFPNLLLAPWLIADYQGRSADLRAPSSRALVGFAALLTLFVPLFGGRPVFVMIVSQTFVAAATPVVLGLMLLLQTRRDVMGEHTLSPRMRVITVVVFLFSLGIAAIGLAGVFRM